jgi:hypothetical protein
MGGGGGGGGGAGGQPAAIAFPSTGAGGGSIGWGRGKGDIGGISGALTQSGTSGFCSARSARVIASTPLDIKMPINSNRDNSIYAMVLRWNWLSGSCIFKMVNNL